MYITSYDFSLSKYKNLWNWFWFEKDEDEDENEIINKKFRIKTFRFLFFNLLAFDMYLLYHFSKLTMTTKYGFHISKIPFLFENNPIYPLIISGEIVKQLFEIVCILSVSCAFGFLYRISCFFCALFFNILYFGSCLDEFQHHYLLCLLLWILIFLEDEQHRYSWWIPTTRLISVQLSIVYCFTVITKMTDNLLFIKGEFSPMFSRKLWIHETITWASNISNLKEETIWIISCICVISMELFLSISIIVIITTRNYPKVNFFYKFFTFIIGLILHISFEILASLSIRFFSVYMILLYWLLLGPTFLIPKCIINKVV